jgi:hypothetical protein
MTTAEPRGMKPSMRINEAGGKVNILSKDARTKPKWLYPEIIE